MGEYGYLGNGSPSGPYGMDRLVCGRMGPFSKERRQTPYTLLLDRDFIYSSGNPVGHVHALFSTCISCAYPFNRMAFDISMGQFHKKGKYREEKFFVKTPGSRAYVYCNGRNFFMGSSLYPYIYKTSQQSYRQQMDIREYKTGKYSAL